MGHLYRSVLSAPILQSAPILSSAPAPVLSASMHPPICIHPIHSSSSPHPYTLPPTFVSARRALQGGSRFFRGLCGVDRPPGQGRSVLCRGGDKAIKLIDLTEKMTQAFAFLGLFLYACCCCCFLMSFLVHIYDAYLPVFLTNTPWYMSCQVPGYISTRYISSRSTYESTRMCRQKMLQKYCRCKER